MQWRRIGTALLVLLAVSGCAVTARQSPQARSTAVALPAAPEIVAEVPSPNVNDRPPGTRISCVVLHHTHRQESALATARYFQDPASGVSAHYVVDRDGSVIRCVPDAKRAWHAGVSRFLGVDNVNDFSIGVEIANRGDNVEPYPEAQMAAVVRLVTWLSRRYGIPGERITRHRDVALPPGRKVDPSDNFDFGRVLRAVALASPDAEATD